MAAADPARGRINVEYCSANPTGPLHVGHGRGAVFGDALAALLEFSGHHVTREYYINDAGAQVDVLARSAFLRYREALGETPATIPEGLYPGDYLMPVAADDRRARRRSLARPAGGRLAARVRRDGARRHDGADPRRSRRARRAPRRVHLGARAGRGRRGRRGAGASGALGLLYTGILPPPKGKPPEDWEPVPQLLFRSTAFGDDVDRPLQEVDRPAWTYFAADIAYHLDKFRRGFAQMIDVWGADHGGYVKRMQAAVRALTAARRRSTSRSASWSTCWTAASR